MNNIDLLKQALASAMACIITMLGFWVGMLKDIPNREEMCKADAAVKQQMADENPYLRDRSLILHRMDTVTGAVKDLDHSVRELNSRLDRMPPGRAATNPPPQDKAS